MGKKLSLDTKQIALNVYDYSRDSTKSVNSIVATVCRATKSSRASIFRYLSERRTTGLRAPRKNLKRLRRVTGISDLMKCEIRRIIYQFHEEEKYHVKGIFTLMIL